MKQVWPHILVFTTLLFVLSAKAEHAQAHHEDSNFFLGLESISPITCESVRRRPDERFDLMPCYEQAVFAFEDEEEPEILSPKSISQKRIAPSSREEIMELFGAPEEDEQVLANEDAPRPIQAFYAALNIGDEALAREYAKKAARYLHDLRATNERFSSLMGYEVGRPRVHDFESLLESYINESDVVVSPELRESLTRLIVDEHEKLSSGASRRDELLIRMGYRKMFEETSIPRAHNGRVEALIFVSLSSPSAKEAVANFLNAASSEQERVRGSARIAPRVFYLGVPTENERAVFLTSFNQPIELNDGAGLGMERHLEDGVAVALVLPAEQALHLEKGLKPQVFYEELLRYVRSTPRENR